ncbi:MAG: hypothetical protein JO108_11005 [Acidobacteriaceae bacterium]|nr:hypothetical protein [Acidobacteriaceae bacterium]
MSRLFDEMLNSVDSGLLFIAVWAGESREAAGFRSIANWRLSPKASPQLSYGAVDGVIEIARRTGKPFAPARFPA